MAISIAMYGHLALPFMAMSIAMIIAIVAILIGNRAISIAIYGNLSFASMAMIIPFIICNSGH